MLWRKESKRVDSLYVDLCDLSNWSEFSDDDSIATQMPAKSNQLALHYRQKAIEQCTMKNWFEAIELYNQALCFAECDQKKEWVGILTNRSSCFFQLQMYDECMVDVKLAKTKADAGIFMSQLNRLTAMCGQKKNQRGKNEQTVYQFKPSLSYDVNKEIPFAANAISIERKKMKKNATTKGEPFFQASRSIDVGKTILIEDGFVATTIERYKR